MAALTSMDIDQHKWVIITDAGRDPDAAAAACYAAAYMKSPRNIFDELVFVCAGGDDPSQNARIIGKCIDDTDRDDVYKAKDIYLVTGEPTKGGHEFEYGKDWAYDTDTFKHMEQRMTGTISIFIAGPVAGLNFDDFIDWDATMLHSVVYVGNEPTEVSRGVNGGGTLAHDDDKAKVLQNLTILNTQLGDGHGIVYLPRNFLRAQPMTKNTLGRYQNSTLANLYVQVTTKFLLGPRPAHIKPELQIPIAEANLVSLKYMCEAFPKDTVRPADSLNDPAFVQAGLLYSQRSDFGPKHDMSIMDIEGMGDVDKGKMRARLAEVTAQIITCQAFINTLGFTAEAHDNRELGLQRYMSAIRQDADMPLMPCYDGIGAAVSCMMSRDNRAGMVFKSFENAFTGNKCDESDRYPMEFIQGMLHFELNKF